MLVQNIVIIYNPNSGRGRGARLANRLKTGLEIRGATVGQVFNSSSTELVYEFCKTNEGNPQGYTLAIIIGGDGTLSPWADAMLKHDFRVPIYAFGRGTANDFSAFLRTAKRVRRVCKIITRDPKLQEIDTLDINGEQYGVNVACGGAFTNGVTSYSKKSKKRFGKLAYMFKALKEAFKMKAQLVKFTVDGEETEAEVFLFLLLNSPNAGSIRKISPTARPWDGELELVAIKRCGFWGKLTLVFSGLFKRLTKNKRVLHIKGVDFRVEILGEPNQNFTRTDIDGNKGGEYPLHVTISPEKLEFVII